MRVTLIFVVSMLAVSAAQADVIVLQPPVNGGGVMRWSKLWIDPTPAGNNLDGDAICYADFVLSQPTTLTHIEWWGDTPPDLGFQIEFWKQDPGTTAYQPYGVFREQGAQPESAFVITSYTVTADPSGTNHYSVDLPTPVNLAANDSVNPRWFAAVIGLTDVPYLEWSWAQGTGGSNKSFQFIRGGTLAGGDLFTQLPEGRAWALNAPVIPEPASTALLGPGLATTAIWFRRKRRTAESRAERRR